jgi:peptide/nickel transport system substrate-binding protein
MTCNRGKRFGVVMAVILVLVMLAQTPAISIGRQASENRTASASATEPTTLKIGSIWKVTTLNPFLAAQQTEWVVYHLIYDTLVTYDQDCNAVPLLATSWTVGDWPEADNLSTPDVNEGANRMWEYHIVSNATWHDGVPLTADDVAYSLNLNMNESMWAFTPYISSRTAEFARAINPTTVDVFLKIPSVHPDILTSVPIVPKHIWSNYTPEEIMSDVTNDHPIGSGPFKFVELLQDQHVLLDRNPTYFRGPVAYDRLEFVLYGNEQVMAQDLKNGNIDAMQSFSPTTYNSLKGQPDIVTAKVKSNSQKTIGFNCYTDRSSSKGNPLLLDENIRRAMQLGVNKSYLINNVWGGNGEVGYALPAPIVPYWHWEPQTPEESLNYNPTRANAMLDAAGYDKRNGNGIRLVNRSDNPYAALDTPLSFKFNVRNDAPEDIAAAPYIKAMWKDIGVDVRIEATAESTLATIVYSEASHDVYMWVWGGDYDPTYLLGSMTTDQIWGWNDPFWSNATYDALFLEQLQQTGTDRQSTVFEMEKIFYESSCLMVTSYPYYLFAWNTLHFTNWGDPVAHPARNIVHYFGGGGQLYMELKPVSAGHGGGVSTTVIIGSGIALVIVVGVAVALLVRRGRKDLRRGDGGTEEDKKKTGLD